MATAVEAHAGVALGVRTRTALSVVVFCAGAGSMATEICASRLLAPYYGGSTVVWANVIGLVLASLSLGYWLGGRLADRRPTTRALGTVVAAGAALVALVPFVARPFLDLSISGIDTLSTGVVVGSFAAALLLFAPPVVLLGTVAPFALRLAVDDVRTAGATAGRLYALSTVGSLVGTFVSALIAIPLIGTQRTLLAAAALLGASAALLLGARWLVLVAALAGLLLVPPGAVKAQSGTIWERESPYQFVQVVQRGETRYLYLNEGVAIHSEWRPDTVLTGDEWDMFLAAPPLLGRPLRHVAILGNAGGTIARSLARFYPGVRIDGVELDPVVTEAGRRFFGLSKIPGLRVVTADARPFLRAEHARYDLIVVDAYRQPYVPFYLATQEFFRLVRERLAPGGIVALNVATVPGDHRLARDVAGTLAWELPQVVSWQALRFSRLVLGLSRPLSTAQLRRRLAAPGPARLAPLRALLARQVRPAGRIPEPWTDDRAPVEWVTDRMILGYALRGHGVRQQLLPTAP
jgi:spermidine synthase